MLVTSSCLHTANGYTPVHTHKLDSRDKLLTFDDISPALDRIKKAIKTKLIRGKNIKHKAVRMTQISEEKNLF